MCGLHAYDHCGEEECIIANWWYSNGYSIHIWCIGVDVGVLSTYIVPIGYFLCGYDVLLVCICVCEISDCILLTQTFHFPNN